MATSANGGVAGVTLRYGAYGDLVASAGSASDATNTELGFIGGLTLSEGIVHLGARDLWPKIGAFLQPDAIDPIRYRYAHGDPVNYRDPSGQYDEPTPGVTAPYPTSPNDSGITINVNWEDLKHAVHDVGNGIAFVAQNAPGFVWGGITSGVNAVGNLLGFGGGGPPPAPSVSRNQIVTANGSGLSAHFVNANANTNANATGKQSIESDRLVPRGAVPGSSRALTAQERSSFRRVMGLIQASDEGFSYERIVVWTVSQGRGLSGGYDAGALVSDPNTIAMVDSLSEIDYLPALLHELGHSFIFQTTYQSDRTAYKQMYNIYGNSPAYGGNRGYDANYENIPWEVFGNQLRDTCARLGDACR